MAYNRKNYLHKRRHAARITALYFEPGRQDRCHRWVWQKYIRDLFHVEYNTYMKWLREERTEVFEASQLSLFDNEPPCK